MSDEYDWRQDEEVAADLELREQTTRTRSPAPLPSYQRPTFVAQWKCSAPRCTTMLDVTDDGAERLAIFNAELERRGERPLPTDCILVCDEHQKIALELRAEKQAERRSRIARNVRLLKDADAPHLMPDVVAELRRDHHPDVDALMASLAGRQSTKRRGSL